MKLKHQWQVPKSEWGPGPWQDEPDQLHWVDEETKLPCVILRGPVGSFCGYVGVPEGHHFYGIGYSEPTKLPFLLALNLLHLNNIEKYYRKEAALGILSIEMIHGGVTYSGDSLIDTPVGHWWFGFDCAHAGDESPYMSVLSKRHIKIPGDVYRDLAYVKAECVSLAQQLHYIGEWMKGD